MPTSSKKTSMKRTVDVIVNPQLSGWNKVVGYKGDIYRSGEVYTLHTSCLDEKMQHFGEMVPSFVLAAPQTDLTPDPDEEPESAGE